VSEINEKLKQMIDEFDLDRRVNELAEQAEVWATRAIETAAEFTHEHRDDVDRALDRISTKLVEGTDGKYADQIDKVRGHVEHGLTRFADRRQDGEA